MAHWFGVLWVAFFLYSHNLAWGRGGRHALPSIPSDIEMSDGGSLDDASDVDGAVLLRRYNDTQELAKILGVRFDQTFVNKAFDFYSRRGLLSDDPNVSPEDIRGFIKEVGGVEDTATLMKVGQAFVEKKKEEFREQASEKGQGSSPSPELAGQLVPQPGRFGRGFGGPDRKGEERSGGPSGPGITMNNPQILPPGNPPPIVQATEKPFPVFPSINIPAPAPAAAAMPFPTVGATVAAPNINVSSPESPRVRQLIPDVAALPESKPESKPISASVPAPAPKREVPPEKAEEKSPKIVLVGPFAEKTPAAQTVQAKVTEAESSGAPAPAAPMEKGALPAEPPPLPAAVPEEERAGIRTVTAGVGIGDTSGSNGTYTLGDASTVSRVRATKAAPQPKSLLEKFYALMGRSGYAGQTTSPEDEADPNRQPTNLLAPVVASGETVFGVPAVSSPLRPGRLAIFVILGGLVMLWIALRTLGYFRRQRPARVEVLANPEHRFRDLN